MTHYCNNDCPKDCIGTEIEQRWTHYPYGRYPSPGGVWKRERAWTAEKIVNGRRELHTMLLPVLVVNDGQ